MHFMWKNCPSTVEVTRWCYKRPRNCKSATIKKTLRPWAHKKRKKVAIPDVIFGAFAQGQRSSKGSLFFILCEKAHVRRDKFLFFNFLSVSWHKGYLMLLVFKIFILRQLYLYSASYNQIEYKMRKHSGLLPRSMNLFYNNPYI